MLAAVERRLTNPEIAAEFVISVRTVESHIAALRRKLGVNNRSGLIDVARARRRAALPLPLTSFVGRENDMSAVCGLLDRHRWVTLVGAPGCGKTRLALEAASVGSRSPVLVELTGTPAGQVADAIAGALGVGRCSDTSLTRALAAALAARGALLLLDGCERVAPDVVRVVRELLANAHDLAVLVTSQGPLDAPDEVVCRIQPLTGDPEAERAAVQLLLDRATAARGGRPPDDPDSAPRLCVVLDGLPLAIELVAARAHDVSLRRLADTIAADRALLDVAAPTGERSLASAFARSWDLLTDEDRRVLTRVSALPGRFDLDMVAAAAPASAAAVLRLVDRSMISADRSSDSGHPSFVVLASLRPLILAQANRGVLDEVRRAHAEHCRDVLDQFAVAARTDDSPDTARRARRSLASAPPALDWSAENDPALAAHLARAIGVLVEQYGADAAAVAAVARAVRRQEVMSQLLGPDGDLAGEALLFSEVPLAGELATRLLSAAGDDPHTQLAAHRLAAFVHSYRGVQESALGHAAAAEDLAGHLHDPWRLASAQQARGMAAPDAETELSAFRSALESFAEAGDALHVNNVRYMMAMSQIDAGNHRNDAEEWVAQCLAYATETGNRHELAHALLTRARLRPDASTAPDDLAAARDVFAELGDLRCLARAHLALAQHSTPEDSLPLLRTAVELSAHASAPGVHETAVTALVRVAWEAGRTREATLALGQLITLIGRQQALAACPEGLRDQIDILQPQVLEGIARAGTGRPPGPPSQPTSS